MEQPERLVLVTKWLYPEVAKRYRTSWEAVERNIRTVSGIIWKENRTLLEELARRELERRPRNAQLLAILASSLDTGPLTADGLGKAVALSGENNNMRVMYKPVYEGGGEAVVTKDGVPLGKLQIGGNDEAPALVAV